MSDPVFFTTLEGEGEASLTEKKSEFIGHAKPVDSEEEALAYVREQKKKYADARHNVWAYLSRGGLVARCSDDGEPQGTGGVPVLDTLRKSGAEGAVVVVTRYFGGILLGAGGLVRAYSAAAHLAIENAHLITYEQYAELRLDCPYSDYQKYLFELQRAGAVIDGTDFAERVVLRFAVRESVLEGLTATIREISGGKVIPTVCGTRFDFR